MRLTTAGRVRAITMWDFSWLERRWAGAGYEDWDRALSELSERGYDTVRIDAYPTWCPQAPTGPGRCARSGPSRSGAPSHHPSRCR